MKRLLVCVCISLVVLGACVVVFLASVGAIKRFLAKWL
jgi:hypothetical protein